MLTCCVDVRSWWPVLPLLVTRWHSWSSAPRPQVRLALSTSLLLLFLYFFLSLALGSHRAPYSGCVCLAPPTSVLLLLLILCCYSCLSALTCLRWRAICVPLAYRLRSTLCSSITRYLIHGVCVLLGYPYVRRSGHTSSKWPLPLHLPHWL